MAKKANYKNQSEKELTTLLTEKRDHVRDFRFRISKGKAKNVKEARQLRKDIARILTELNSRKGND